MKIILLFSVLISSTFNFGLFALGEDVNGRPQKIEIGTGHDSIARETFKSSGRIFYGPTRGEKR
jgi:hypothetical protein